MERVFILAITRVPKNNISLLRIIGKGGFGEVYEGIVDGLPQSPAKAIRVAVKVCLDFTLLLQSFQFKSVTKGCISFFLK